MTLFSSETPVVVQALPPEGQDRYKRANTLKTFDNVLVGLGVISAFGALIWFLSGGALWRVLAVIVAWNLALVGLRYLASSQAQLDLYRTVFSGGAVLRHRILRHLTRLPLSAFYRLHPGKIAQTLSEDMAWLENYTAFFAPTNRGEMATILTLLLGVAVLHWPAAVAAVVFWGLGALVVRGIQKGLDRGFRFRSEGMAEGTRHFMEYAEGIQVVRAFGDTKAAEESYAHWVEVMREGFRKAIGRNVPVAGLANALAMSAVGVGAIVAILTLPEEGGVLRVVGAIGLLTGTLISVRTIIGGSLVQRIAMTARDNIDEIRAMPVVTEGDAVAPKGPAEIAFEGVDFAYEPGRAVLRDITFTARPGTLTAIVGRSGSGKTTIANLILRFWDPEAGQVTLNGRDARDFTMRSYTDRIAPVFQETMLLRDSVANNIRVGRPGASDAEVIAAAKAAQVHETILALPDGYDEVVGPGGQTLSGGERQRVTIARAILKEADVVILDEATSALDPENERDIQRAFEALARGKTVFVIAHRLSTIVDADNILLLDEGRLVDQGRHEDLLARQGLYRDLWESYSAIADWAL